MPQNNQLITHISKNQTLNTILYEFSKY